jgi:hypothetical protein
MGYVLEEGLLVVVVFRELLGGLVEALVEGLKFLVGQQIGVGREIALPYPPGEAAEHPQRPGQRGRKEGGDNHRQRPYETHQKQQ